MSPEMDLECYGGSYTWQLELEGQSGVVRMEETSRDASAFESVYVEEAAVQGVLRLGVPFGF